MSNQEAIRAYTHLKSDGFAMGPGWKVAHEICQAHEGEAVFDAIHALAHLIEGDKSNSDYWCRRAGIEPLEDDVDAAAKVLAAQYSLI